MKGVQFEGGLKGGLDMLEKEKPQVNQSLGVKFWRSDTPTSKRILFVRLSAMSNYFLAAGAE